MKNEHDEIENEHDKGFLKLLRNVEVPRDLNAILKAIPKNVDVEGKSQIKFLDENMSRRSTGKTWFRMGIGAAAALAVLVFSYALIALTTAPEIPSVTKLNTKSKSEDKQATDEPAENLTQKADDESKTMIVKRSDTELANLEEFRRQLDLERQEIELARLRIRANTLRRKLRPEGISSDDRLSIAKVLAKHAEISFGSNEERVEKELKQIIEQWPESPGAKIARDLVSAN